MRRLLSITYHHHIRILYVHSVVRVLFFFFNDTATTEIYTFYEEAPRIWNLSAISDQQIAGLIMKLWGSRIL